MTKLFRLTVMVSIVALTIAAVACSTSLPATPTPPTAPAAPPPNPPASAPPVNAVQSMPTELPSGAANGITLRLVDGSVARYIVGEQLANRSLPNDAIGETSDVNGNIVFDDTGSIQPRDSKIEVNVQSLTSDESRRDNFIRNNALESIRFPTAEFAVNDAPGLPWPLPESGEAEFQLSGDMTVHGLTRPLTWDVTAQFGPGDVTGRSTGTITFDQFGMSKPSLFFIVSVEDEIKMELDFVATVN